MIQRHQITLACDDCGTLYPYSIVMRRGAARSIRELAKAEGWEVRDASGKKGDDRCPPCAGTPE